MKKDKPSAEPNLNGSSKKKLLSPTASSASKLINRSIQKIPDPLKIDWNEQDIALAQEYGCSRERIRQLRRKFGLPNHPYSKKPREFTMRCQAILRAKEQLTGRTYGEIERILGFQLHGFPIRNFLKEHVALGFRERHIDWEAVNWNLSNKDIGGIWGARENVVSAWRRKLGKQSPLFGPNLSNAHALVKAEKAKAMK